MPAATGSLPIPNTIGIVEVAAFAARAEASPPTPQQHRHPAIDQLGRQSRRFN
jgi:hypothetical protein